MLYHLIELQPTGLAYRQYKWILHVGSTYSGICKKRQSIYCKHGDSDTSNQFVKYLKCLTVHLLVFQIVTLVHGL